MPGVCRPALGQLIVVAGCGQQHLCCVQITCVGSLSVATSPARMAERHAGLPLQSLPRRPSHSSAGHTSRCNGHGSIPVRRHLSRPGGSISRICVAFARGLIPGARWSSRQDHRPAAMGGGGSRRQPATAPVAAGGGAPAHAAVHPPPAAAGPAVRRLGRTAVRCGQSRRPRLFSRADCISPEACNHEYRKLCTCHFSKLLTRSNSR